MCFQTIVVSDRLQLLGCSAGFKSDFAMETMFALLLSRKRPASAHLARKTQRDLDNEHMFTQSACRGG